MSNIGLVIQGEESSRGGREIGQNWDMTPLTRVGGKFLCARASFAEPCDGAERARARFRRLVPICTCIKAPPCDRVGMGDWRLGFIK